MDNVFAIMAAVMAANVLSVLFLWGLARAGRIYRDEDLDWRTGVALVIPALIFSAAWWVSGPPPEPKPPHPLAVVGPYKPGN